MLLNLNIHFNLFFLCSLLSFYSLGFVVCLWSSWYSWVAHWECSTAGFRFSVWWVSYFSPVFIILPMIDRIVLWDFLFHCHFSAQKCVHRESTKEVWWISYLSSVFAIFLHNCQDCVHKFLFHCFSSTKKCLLHDFLIFKLFLVHDFASVVNFYHPSLFFPS